MENKESGILQKALRINLDDNIYGSIAEIGAGQEVSRNFFQAGAASGTIARSISAYDMAVSDSIYGKTKDGRYVNEQRLLKMLDFEYCNLVEILGDTKKSDFFSFANTVSALNFKKDNYCHGWMGVRFQLRKNKEFNQIIIHFRLWEKENLLQQRTVGIIGVNLIYAAFFLQDKPNELLRSLIDNTGSDRVSIDMIRVEGPDLNYIDNRLLAVQLVKNNMSEAVMFDRHGKLQHPSDMLYKKNVMILRGSFRPITYVGFDMLKTGYHLLKEDVNFTKDNTIALCEITMDNLTAEGDFNERDFLDRADILCGMGQNVLISNFREYYKLVSYMSQFKTLALRLIIGADTFKKVMDPKYYSELKGGVLEAFGRLFAQNLRIYLYPALIERNNNILTSENLPVKKEIKHLYKHLIANKMIVDIQDYKKQWLHIYPNMVRAKINNHSTDWEKLVPAYVSKFIKTHKVLDFKE